MLRRHLQTGAERTQRRRWLGAAWIAGLALGGAVATSEARASDETPPVPDHCRPRGHGSEPSNDTVGELESQFSCLFDAGDYSASARVLERACALTDSSRCLLNLGIVHHALRHCEVARSYYERYVDQDPYDEGRAAAELALEELHGVCGTGQPSSASSVSSASSALAAQPAQPVQSAEPVTLDSATAPRWASAPSQPPIAESRGPVLRSWLVATLLAGGAAGALASIYYGLQAGASERELEELAGSSGTLSRSDARALAIEREGLRREGASRAFGVASGVLLGSGAAVWLLLPDDADTGLSVSVGSSLAVRYGGSF